MARVKVTAYDTDRPVVVEEGATKGATLGVNLFDASGNVLDASSLAALLALEQGAAGGQDAVPWLLLTDVPANVAGLASLSSSGLVTRTAAGAIVARSIAVASTARLTITEAAGNGGNPTLDLANLADAGGGTIRKFDRDSYGRVSGTSSADTDDLAEGATNLYFTEQRARDAVDGDVTALSIASGVVNIDLSLGKFFTLLLTANVTSITFSNLPASGKPGEFAVRIRQDGTGGWTVALPSSFKPTGGSDTSVASAANAYTLLTALTFDQGTRFEYAMQEIAA